MLKLLKNIILVDKAVLSKTITQAVDIVESIDPQDAVFFSAALALNAVLWSDDKALKKQKEVIVLNTKEILSLKILQ